MADRIVTNARGRRQTRKLPRNAKWSDPAKRDAFLAHLAMTGNVTESAALVRLRKRGAYEQRDANPEFRARWEAAIDEVRQSLWGGLLAEASRRLNPVPVSRSECEARPVDPGLALDLLKLHAAGKISPRGVKPRHRVPMSADELRVLIFEKLQDKRKELKGDG